MSWLQIEVVATPATVAKLEEEAFSAGAVSVALVSESDEPVLEPAPGEMPLWSTIRLQALVPLDVDLKALSASMGAALDVRFVGEADWQAHARSFAVDAVFADRIHLRAPLASGETYDASYLPLYLEPGLAFGSGSHPTTRMCLEWLAEHVREGSKVLDVGCGSGVLAIAAAIAGANVVGVDYDDQAVLATRENAERNSVLDKITVMSLSEWQAAPHDGFDVVVANILAEPLRTLAMELTSALKASGSIVLAGLLEDQSEHVKQAYAKRIAFEDDHVEEGWTRLVGKKLSSVS